MDDMRAIYKILALLNKNRGNEEFDYAEISAEALKMSYPSWEQLLIAMQEGGYIKGLITSQRTMDKFPHIVEPIRIRITLAGIEYLSENSVMAKAKEALRMVGEII